MDIEGIAAAKAKGIHIGRLVKEVPDNFRELVRLWEKRKFRWNRKNQK